jgi:hypothetical protein
MRPFFGAFAVVVASECFMTVGYHVERLSLAQRHRSNQLRPAVHGRALPPLESSLYSLDTYNIPFCLNDSSSIRIGSKFAAKNASLGSECMQSETVAIMETATAIMRAAVPATMCDTGSAA